MFPSIESVTTANGRVVNFYGQFDSMTELLAVATSETFRCATNREAMADIDKRATDAKWHGYAHKSTADIVRIARTGWQFGADRIQKSMGSIDVQPAQSVRRRATWADDGHEIDMQRVYAGNLDTAWRKVKRLTVTAPKRVHIVCNIVINAHIPHETLFWRGAAAAKLADVLVEAGYAVKMTMATLTNDEGVRLTKTTIKDYADPMDINSVAAAIALPAMLRNIYFNLCRRLNPTEQEGNYGSAMSAETNPELLLFDTDELRVVVPDRKGHAFSAESATDWVAEQVTKIQGPQSQAA